MLDSSEDIMMETDALRVNRENSIGTQACLLGMLMDLSRVVVFRFPGRGSAGLGHLDLRAFSRPGSRSADRGQVLTARRVKKRVHRAPESLTEPKEGESQEKRTRSGASKGCRTSARRGDYMPRPLLVFTAHASIAPAVDDLARLFRLVIGFRFGTLAARSQWLRS